MKNNSEILILVIHFLRYLTCGLLMAPGMLLAQAVTVDNIRIWAAPDNTRIVFDVSAPVRYQLSMLEDPYRLVIDLHEVRLKRQPAQPAPSDKFLQRLRDASNNGNDWRFVLDLKKFAKTKSFPLPPNEPYGHRLVVDIFNPEAEQKPPIAPLEVEQRLSRSREIHIDEARVRRAGRGRMGLTFAGR